MSRSSHSPSRRRRRITRILAASGLLLGLGSCTAVLDLENYGSAAEQICSLLDRCLEGKENDGCQGIIETHLFKASQADRETWLNRFTDYDCLASCSAGRSCLNIPPLCVAPGVPCKRTLDCCGSLEGYTDCNVGFGDTCCQARGTPCSTERPCCNGAGACDQNICGGISCTKGGQACARDGECCTKRCVDQVCAETVCHKELFECATDEECCHHFCDPTSHRCALPPVCAKAKEPCAAPEECCGDLACVTLPGAPAGTCQKSTCTAAFLECATDDQCCSGRCDPTSFSCASACTATGAACGADAECCAGSCVDNVCKSICSTTACAVNDDCCTGHCSNGFCAAPCNPFEAHPGCRPGGPLVSSTDACVASVCDADPFCCCGAWDDLCVAAFSMEGPKCTDSCL